MALLLEPEAEQRRVYQSNGLLDDKSVIKRGTRSDVNSHLDLGSP